MVVHYIRPFFYVDTRPSNRSAADNVSSHDIT